MPAPGTTALVILLPAAEPLLDLARAVNPAAVRAGLPAHVTLSYPFLPVTNELATAVRRLAGTAPALEITLAELVVSTGFVAVGAPAAQRLADRAGRWWPQVQPYGGRFGERPPAHVTVALGASAAEAERIAAGARELLPIRCTATGVELVELTATGWRSRVSAPLG